MGESSFRDEVWRSFLRGLAALLLLCWLYGLLDGTIGVRAIGLCRTVLSRSRWALGPALPGAPGQVVADFAARRGHVDPHFPLVAALVGAVVVVCMLRGSLRVRTRRRALGRVHGLFERSPGVGAICRHARQLGRVLCGGASARGFCNVVAVESLLKSVCPARFRAGSGVDEVRERGGRGLATVLVPTSPTPSGGRAAMQPPQSVVDLDMTEDEALRYAVTAGMLVRRARGLPGNAMQACRRHARRALGTSVLKGLDW